MVEDTHNRLDLATRQLETSLNLFLDDKNYASSLTLAGAEEEIFGRELIRRGGKSALDREFLSSDKFERMTSGNALDRKAYIAKKNMARNALKHLQEDQGPTITIDLEEAACWMLARATENGRELGFELQRCREFEDWFYENIVGV